MEDTKLILKDSIRYSTTTYLVISLGVISGFVTRGVLSPMLMGTFSELMIMFEYIKYHHLGMFNTLERELPYYNGKKDLNRAQQIKDIGFSFTLFTSFLLAVALIIASFILPLDRNLLIGMRILAIALVIQEMVTYLTVLAKTHHKFTLLSKYNLYTAIFQTTAIVYFGINFGLFGLLWATILTGIVGMAYLMTAKFKFKFLFPLSIKMVLGLLAIGTPLLLNDITFMSLMNMDRFSIIKFFDKAELGYYSIATMVTGYLFVLPNLLYSVLFPRFYESFGKTGDIKALRNFFEVPTVVISYLMAAIIGLLILILPFLINYIIPSYKPGVMAADILLLGVFFISIKGMSNYLLTALNKQKQMIVLSLFGISLAMFFNYLFIKKLNCNIEGVAAAMLITYFIYSTAFMAYAFRHYSKKFSHVLLFLGEIYLPFVWLVLVVSVLNSFFIISGQALKIDCAHLFFRLSLFVIAYLPLLYYLERKTSIIKKLINL